LNSCILFNESLNETFFVGDKKEFL